VGAIFSYPTLFFPRFSFLFLRREKHASMYVRVCGIFVGTVFLRHPPVLLTSRPDTIRQGPRSSGPIIQTSRRGEDRRDGVSKATCSPSARCCILRPLAGQSKVQRSERESRAERNTVRRERKRERCYLFIPYSLLSPKYAG